MQTRTHAHTETRTHTHARLNKSHLFKLSYWLCVCVCVCMCVRGAGGCVLAEVCSDFFFFALWWTVCFNLERKHIKECTIIIITGSAIDSNRSSLWKQNKRGSSSSNNNSNDTDLDTSHTFHIMNSCRTNKPFWGWIGKWDAVSITETNATVTEVINFSCSTPSSKLFVCGEYSTTVALLVADVRVLIW